MTLYGIKECWQNVQQSRWPAAQCQILSSSVTEMLDEDGGSAARFHVSYQYSWNNQTYTRDTIARDYPNFTDYSTAYGLLQHYPPGSTTNCILPLNSPEAAILFQTPRHSILILLAGAIFLVGPAYFFRLVIFPDQKPGHRFTSFTIGFIFTSLGGLALWFTLIFPVMEWSRSLPWKSVPCTIERNALISKPGTKGGTVYRADLVYRYSYAGTEFKNNRIELLHGYSSGKIFKESLLAKYPVGTQAICFVNPSRPWESLLTRGLSWTMLFSFLALFFLYIGLYLLRDYYRSFRNGQPSH